MAGVARATVSYGVCRQAPRHIQYTRAVCQCPLRGTYFALKSEYVDPVWMSFTLLLQAGDSLGLPAVYLIGTKFISVGYSAIFPLFCVLAVVYVLFLNVTL